MSPTNDTSLTESVDTPPVQTEKPHISPNPTQQPKPPEGESQPSK